MNHPKEFKTSKIFNFQSFHTQLISYFKSKFYLIFYCTACEAEVITAFLFMLRSAIRRITGKYQIIAVFDTVFRLGNKCFFQIFVFFLLHCAQ